jgi:crossover junction endodeoxyribonuclease RuvC
VKGALALVVAGELVQVIDMPTRQVTLAGGTVKTRIDTAELHRQVWLLQPDVAFLEQVNSHSGEGAMGAFAFGRGVGAVEGVLGALGLRVTEVPPQSWKRAVGVRKGPDGDKKGPSKARAAKLWPAWAPRLLKARADKSEAALIARYGHDRLMEL